MKKKYLFRTIVLIQLLLCLSISPVFSQYQNALDFDGNSDFVSIPAASALIAGPATKLSLSCWVYPTHTPAGFPDFDGFTGFRNDLDADFYIIALSSTSIEARLRTSTGTYTISHNNMTLLNNWQHFVLTYDNNKLRLYYNGTKIDSVTASGNISNTTVPLTIGDVIYQSTNFFLGGRVDEVGLWNRALNPQEVNCIYKSPINTAISGLQLYYDFNQGIAGGNNGSVSSLLPKTGSLTGSLTTFSLTGTGSNWVNGVVNYTPLTIQKCAGQSYSFNSQTLTSTGAYTKKLVAANGCDSVVGLTLLIPDTAIALTGSSLTVDFVPGASYQWKNCTTHAALANGSANFYTPIANGSYYVVIDLPGTPACHDSSSCFNFINLSTKNLGDDYETLVYPNPFQDDLVVKFNSVQTKVIAQISDLSGKLIWEKSVENCKEFKADLSELQVGFYFLELTHNGQSKKIKLIKN